MGRRFDISILTAAVLIWAAGCSEHEEEGGAPAYRKEVRTQAGDCSLVVLLDRTEISMAETVRMELVAEAPIGVVPGLPVNSGSWEGWIVSDVSQAERSALPGGRVRTRRVYTLEPYLPGNHAVPEFGIIFDGPGVEPAPVLVGEVPVVVASVLEGDPEEVELVDPYPDMAPPVGRIWWWVGGGVLVVIVGAAGVFLAVRGRGKSELVEPGEREVMLGELGGMLGVGPLEAARVSALAGRVQDLPESLGAKIEEFAFSAGDTGDVEVRRAAEELRAFLEAGGQGRKNGKEVP